MPSTLPSAPPSVLLQMRSVIISSKHSRFRHRLQSHPCRCTCGKSRCSFSHPAQVWVSFCLDVWQGAWPELPSSTLGLIGFWAARSEAELSPSSGSTAACAGPFPGRYRASTCQTALAGSPDVGFWPFPHRGQGQIPSLEAPIGCLCLCLLMTLKAVSCG